MLGNTFERISSNRCKDEVENTLGLFEEGESSSDNIAGNKAGTVNSCGYAHGDFKCEDVLAGKVRLNFFRVVFCLFVGFGIFLFVDDAGMTGEFEMPDYLEDAKYFSLKFRQTL